MTGQVAEDRRSGHHQSVVVLEVPPDGVGAGVKTGGGELLAQLDDQVHDLGGVVRGTALGRRERGSTADSPSAR